MVSLLGGVFLGWSLGANDAANVFGSAVSSRMVKFWTAAVRAGQPPLPEGPQAESRSGLQQLDVRPELKRGEDPLEVMPPTMSHSSLGPTWSNGLVGRV